MTRSTTGIRCRRRILDVFERHGGHNFAGIVMPHPLPLHPFLNGSFVSWPFVAAPVLSDSSYERLQEGLVKIRVYEAAMNGKCLFPGLQE